MEKPRYEKTGEYTIYGDYLYDRIIPQDHFLRKLKEAVNWNRFTYRIIKLYKGEGVVGRPPFDPAQVLRMELIAYLYQLTERQVEAYVNDNLSAKYFVDLVGFNRRSGDRSHGFGMYQIHLLHMFIDKIIHELPIARGF